MRRAPPTAGVVGPTTRQSLGHLRLCDPKVTITFDSNIKRLSMSCAASATICQLLWTFPGSGRHGSSARDGCYHDDITRIFARARALLTAVYNPLPLRRPHTPFVRSEAGRLNAWTAGTASAEGALQRAPSTRTMPCPSCSQQKSAVTRTIPLTSHPARYHHILAAGPKALRPPSRMKFEVQVVRTI